LLKHRVIPCVLLKDWQLTKSVNFKEYRTIGHPKVTARVYNIRNVDELIVLDIDASSGDEEINYTTLKDIADECFMPLTLGGGVKSISDINSLLKIGADKVSINTVAIENPSFINEASKVFGSQCIVVSIDVLKVGDEYKVFNRNIGVVEDLNLISWAKKCENLGAGELLITSVERDGTERGYDIELISLLAREVSIPLIANGGAKDGNDCADALEKGADAVAMASIFHFSHQTPDSVKRSLQQRGFPVRL
jgi:cyclase